MLTPMIRPGMLRASACRWSPCNAACGPPKPIGTPKRWVEPDGDVGAHLAGASFSSASDRMSAATMADGVVFVQRRDLGGEVAHMADEVPGYWKIAPKTPAASSSSGRPTLMSMPRGSARVLMTAMVCGCSSCRRRRPRCWPWTGLAALGHRHRLGRCGRLVQQRGVGHVQPGQVADHGLEVQQRLEPALTDLGLIGRVGGVPGRVFQDVAQDRRRRGGAVIALTDQRGQNLVLTRHLLSCGRARRVPSSPGPSPAAQFLPDRGRDGGVDQIVQRLEADYLAACRASRSGWDRYGGGWQSHRLRSRSVLKAIAALLMNRSGPAETAGASGGE